MPANSLIVGVDLSAIKPIPRTITFQSDITSDKCRTTIKRHFKSWKADTILHDGAPNVGTAWVQDAFSQAELVLQALKLATEFLCEGGTFITKVFRSKDYNALLWVFNQLFAKVEATKPPSSRSVSAEIFVVCRAFKAPKRIDPKFLDPRHVFAEISNPTPNVEAKVFNPEKKKRKRDGYEDGEYTQFKEVCAFDFIKTADPIAMLGNLNRFTFNQHNDGDMNITVLERIPETTAEIRKCCLDLKVLGRKEFRALLRWRLKARAIFDFSLQSEITSKVNHETTKASSISEEVQIQQELQSLHDKENSRKKKAKRQENERKHKEIIRFQMHMMPPTDIGLEQTGPNGEDSMFALAAVEKDSSNTTIMKGKMGLPVKARGHPGDESGDYSECDGHGDLDRELDALYHEYQERKSESDAKYRIKNSRKEHHDGDWDGFSECEESSGKEFQLDADSDSSSDGDENCDFSIIPKHLDNSIDDRYVLSRRASQFFEQDIFHDIGFNEPEKRNNSKIPIKTSTSNFCSQQLSIDVDIKQASQARLKHITLANPSKRLKATQPRELLLPEQFEYLNGETHATESGKSDVGNDSIASFESVPDEGEGEWEKQNEFRSDGRLGEFYIQKYDFPSN